MLNKYMSYTALVLLLSFSALTLADKTADQKRNELDKIAEKENMPQRVYNSVLNDIDKKERSRENTNKKGKTISK